MDRYEEVINSLEKVIESLQSAVDNKQKLLDAALQDLAKGNDCKNCANIDQCSAQRIERNLVYGSCSKWKWRGDPATEKAS